MLSVNEVCQVTGLSRKTIYRKMNSGELPYSLEGKRRVVSEAAAMAIKPSESKVLPCHCDQLREEMATLTQEVTQLRKAIERLTIVPPGDQAQKPKKAKTKPTGGTDNARRAADARARVFELLESYQGQVPSVAQMHRDSGIDRGTISKYLKEWNARLID